MSWRDEVDKIMTDLIESHIETLEKTHNSQYIMAAEDEVNRLQKIGFQNVSYDDPNNSDWLSQLFERMVSQTRFYDELFHKTMENAINRNGRVGDERDRIFSSESDGGLIIDKRGEMEEIKRVDPDGNSRFQTREVDYVWYTNPVTYFNWLTSTGIVEARNAGRMSVHKNVSEISEQVWIDPLDESSTVMSARLHGLTWDVDEIPFLPPITHHGSARLYPIIGDDTPYIQSIPSMDDLKQDREVWFAQYHEMRQDSTQTDNFTESIIGPSDTQNMEFIYSAYLPRNVSQYLPEQ